jgi:hypothetical protein
MVALRIARAALKPDREHFKLVPPVELASRVGRFGGVLSPANEFKQAPLVASLVVALRKQRIDKMVARSSVFRRAQRQPERPQPSAQTSVRRPIEKQEWTDALRAHRAVGFRPFHEHRPEVAFPFDHGSGQAWPDSQTQHGAESPKQMHAMAVSSEREVSRRIAGTRQHE